MPCYVDLFRGASDHSKVLRSTCSWRLHASPGSYDSFLGLAPVSLMSCILAILGTPGSSRPLIQAVTVSELRSVVGRRVGEELL